jgi:hypothetical protein
MKEDMKVDREERKAEMKAIQDKRMEAAIPAMRTWRKEVMAYQEMTEAHLECKEPTSENMESESEHWEVPNGHVAVETGKAPNKQHRGRHLAAELSQKPKEWTRGKLWIPEENGRRPQRDDPPCMSGTLRGKRRRENFDEGHCETRSHDKDEKRLWKSPECEIGIKDP